LIERSSSSVRTDRSPDAVDGADGRGDEAGAEAGEGDEFADAIGAVAAGDGEPCVFEFFGCIVSPVVGDNIRHVLSFG